LLSNKIGAQEHKKFIFFVVICMEEEKREKVLVSFFVKKAI